MKILNKLLGAGLFALVIMLAVPQKIKAQDVDDEISFQTFYDELSPYGTWINDAEYGDVWVPDAGADFRPYATNGHWVVTDYGNTWVSDYEWGWAPFHYGRWRFDDYYGWEWIPDYEWGPAWVDWQSADGYYGWAPLTPGISLDIAFGGGYTIPDNYWVFAPGAYINSPNIYNYYVPRARINRYIHRGRYIRNTYAYNNRRYITGPRPRDIQRFTHSQVNVYHINNASRPGAIRVQNNQVNIYRPRVQKAPEARPSRVVDATAYRNANPNQRIANHGTGVAPANHQNAQRLANFARTAPADNKIVHENNRNGRPAGGNSPDRNNNRPAGNNNPSRNNNRPSGRTNNPPENTRPAVVPPGNQSDNRPARPEVPHTDGNPTPVTRPGQPQQNRDQQIQQRRQRQHDQQNSPADQQQRNQQRQQQMQQNQQRNAAQQQQREQQRQQQMQLRRQQRTPAEQQQAAQRQQQAAQQRQQQEQQRQAAQQQQVAQQRQQQEQQRQAAQQQQAAQQRQQQEQQRQQQQQAAQQRQQQEQQRQQQEQQPQQRPQRESRPQRPQR